MFVMLSVRTTATVRERPAETVKKAININQLFKNINSRKTPKCLRRKHQKKASDSDTLNNARSPDRNNSTGKATSESDSSSSSSSSDSDQKNQQRDKNRPSKPSDKIDKPSILIGTPTTTTIAGQQQPHPLGRLVKIPEEDPRKLSTTDSVSSTEKQDHRGSANQNQNQNEQWQQQQQQQQQNQTQQETQEHTKSTFLLPELNNFRKPPTVQTRESSIPQTSQQHAQA